MNKNLGQSLNKTINNENIKPLALPTPHSIKPATGQRTAPRCSVGLLTWNGGQDALACMESLLRQTEAPLELVWIDNASADGTPERLRERFPQLPEPLRNPRNLGFCIGHNQGLAACQTPYYLALNQDVTLAADYIEKLCDWMDEQPELALTSGLILSPAAAGAANAGGAVIYSAGMAFPRARFAFELGMGRPPAVRYRTRRIVPAVDGSTMMLRVEACRRASLPPGDVFPPEFFAYGEEVDLALRLARAGYACGVEGRAQSVHRARGSGGFKQTPIRARFFCNHWLLTLRHDPWRTILRELPWIVRGELQYWLPEYAQHPRAFLLALRNLARQWTPARRFYHQFESAFHPTAPRMQANKKLSQEALRQSAP